MNVPFLSSRRRRKGIAAGVESLAVRVLALTWLARRLVRHGLRAAR